MLPNIFNNSNSGNSEEFKTILETTSLDILFSEEFQRKNISFRKDFNEFFKTKYKEIETVREVTYSTNHVTYYFFKNEETNDVRILRAESGCFHSQQDFVTLKDIEKHIQDLEKEKSYFMESSHFKSKEKETTEWCDNKINSVKKVISTYENLTRKPLSKPKI